MTSTTWADLRSEIEKELDLEDEGFITPEELRIYVNDAIDEAEAEIIGASPDYFLTVANLDFIEGQSDYVLPEGMYATKIRKIIFVGGPEKFEIKRLRRLEDSMFEHSDTAYKYMLVNSGPNETKLKLFPAASVSAAGAALVWHLRNAKRIVDDTDIVDLPEAKGFIKEHVKNRCIAKEGFPTLVSANVDVEKQRKLLIDTLSDMVPDEDNLIRGDFSFYDDFDHWGF